MPEPKNPHATALGAIRSEKKARSSRQNVLKAHEARRVPEHMKRKQRAIYVTDTEWTGVQEFIQNLRGE